MADESLDVEVEEFDVCYDEGDEYNCALLCMASQMEEKYFNNPKHYTLFSGGAVGSDLIWQKVGAKFGVHVKVFSFERHGGKNRARVVLSQEQLKEADEFLHRANKTLKRHFPTGKSFVNNLLRRNWYQVKDTDKVFAITKIGSTRRTVEGGTGWAVQMAIDYKRPVYVFDIAKSAWHQFDYSNDKFVSYRGTPKLSLNFTGIGTRSLPEAGKKAIEQVFEVTFGSSK